MLTFIESGRKRRGEKAKCKHCKKVFVRRAAPVKGEKKKYCGRSCAAASHVTSLIVRCSLCNKKFQRTPSKVKLSKHGFSFCGRVCKEKAQSLGGKFSSMQPSHYGTGDGKSTYRALAFQNLDLTCEDCGIDFLPLLMVHHKDGDRSNNVISNLAILCCNHHAIRHMKKKVIDGVVIWTKCNKSLTSPKDILTLLDFLKGACSSVA